MVWKSLPATEDSYFAVSAPGLKLVTLHSQGGPSLSNPRVLRYRKDIWLPRACGNNTSPHAISSMNHHNRMDPATNQSYLAWGVQTQLCLNFWTAGDYFCNIGTRSSLSLPIGQSILHLTSPPGRKFEPAYQNHPPHQSYPTLSSPSLQSTNQICS